ncbi:helix-turn-helix protein [Kitasatospora atroaurantiaca]|uniref:Helix-turn-helix protein n=1 Tax=Kitasatospora atroaurantiaca TaxID=285545 RepID=A0A561EPN0_9ACTN|nr:helix-turn-helix protein [Kitasatospora atroaurantiaca]
MQFSRILLRYDRGARYKSHGPHLDDREHRPGATTHAGPTVRFMAATHTAWKIPDDHRTDPAYIEAAAAAALGQAVHDRRNALGLTGQELADRARLTVDEVEQIEGGGTAPTLALLRSLASALDAQLDASIYAEQARLMFVAHAI